MNNNLKKSLTHALAIVLFLVLVLIYFAPAVFQGKTIHQGDTQKAMGMSQELFEYYVEEGARSAWTGSMFSGMPSYHIQVYGNPPNYLDYIEKPVKSINYFAGSIVLISLICFYILMCIMGINRWLAIAGAIAYAFASYNIIILVAGHVTKAYVMAYMPLTVGGIILLFQRKWLWGVITLILGLALSIMNSHIQITYYLAIFCVFLFLGYAINELKKKNYSTIYKIIGISFICIIVALLPNVGNLYSNYEVAQESMRGPSDLTLEAKGPSEKVSTGLDKDYAFMWSYGKGELLTLLIPNAYGGESGGVLGKESALYKELKAHGQQVGKEIRTATYWGDQPGTSGPVYFGAIVCFLFLLGMFVIKNPLKWWIAGGSLFFILLALGRNLDWFNDFMFHYLPMYNKFRTPSMALVIPGLAFPLIGMWGLKEIFTDKLDKKLLQKSLIWSMSIIGGLCLIIWLIPGMFLDFQSVNDSRILGEIPSWYYEALIQDRKSLASSDALRSLIFVVLTGGLIYYYLNSKNKQKQAKMYIAIGVTILIFADLWMIDKRYLNDSTFSSQTLVETFQKSAADIEILKDKDPSYRVLNLNDPFQESNTSYFHKSIGGYHAAKLRRYQELIDHRLSQEIRGTIAQSRTLGDMINSFVNCPTLNMLNMRYVIYDPGQMPVKNPSAYGNVWFVDNYEIVENADAEILSLNTIQPLETAVIDKRFASNLEGLKIIPDSMALIKLDSYKPDILIYTSEAATEQLAVFSEIYYEKGWKAFIDGELVPHFRVDWTLRGMRIPAGKHTVEFKFIPDNYNRAIMLSSVSSGVILLLLLFAFGIAIWKYTKKGTDNKIKAN